MKAPISSPLYSCAGGERWVEAGGNTLADLLADLDRRYPGIRFRVVDEQDRLRTHMRFFDNNEQTFSLHHPLRTTDEVLLVQALIGG